jgi:hypothetical protein
VEATSHCAKKRATYVCLCVLTEGQEEAGRRAGGREATEGGAQATEGRRAGGREATEGGARATEATAQEGGEGQCRVCGQ